MNFNELEILLNVFVKFFFTCFVNYGGESMLFNLHCLILQLWKHLSLIYNYCPSGYFNTSSISINVYKSINIDCKCVEYKIRITEVKFVAESDRINT